MKRITSIYLKTGIIVLVIVSILYFGINFLKGRGIWGNQNYYYAVYDKIDGLAVSNNIVVNGFKIGQVSDIKFADDMSGRLVVELAVEKKYKLPKQTTARIFSSDLMGTKSISLIYGKEKEFQQNGDTLFADFEGSLADMVSVEMLPLKNKAHDLMKEFEDLIAIVSNVLNEKSQVNIEASILSIRKTFKNLERSTSKIDSIMLGGKSKIDNIILNIESISNNLEKNNDHIQSLLQNIDNITDSVSKANITQLVANVGEIAHSLSFVGEQIEKGEGNIGKLVNDENLYNNLQDLTYNLNRVLEDLRENPKRYVRFSAFDFGKSIYLTDSSMVNKKKGKVIYTIRVKSSNKSILIKPENFNNYRNIEENSIQGVYVYTYGRFKKIEKARIKLKEIKNDFPEATILQVIGGMYKEVF